MIGKVREIDMCLMIGDSCRHIHTYMQTISRYVSTCVVL